MASYEMEIAPIAEGHLREIPFPFWRQINQRFFKLKDNPRPEGADQREDGSWRLLRPAQRARAGARGRAGTGGAAGREPAYRELGRSWDVDTGGSPAAGGRVIPPIRVLLVDDHQILREGVRRLLEEWKQEEAAITIAGEAETVPDAMASLGQLSPDVVVLDLALPGLSGIEVCRRAHGAGVRVVILTMHVSAEHVRRARAAGAAAYVVKGSGISALADAIRRVAAGGEGPFPETPEDPLERLTAREREVLVEVAHGRSNREIASRLDISIHTVNTHRIHVMEKLGVHDAVALTRMAFSAGLLI